MKKDSKAKTAKASRGATPKAAGQDAFLVDFMTELAALMLAAGISATEFEHAAKLGFIGAASRLARLRNARVNRSAVAAMTGLSRVEVKKLAELGAPPFAGSGSRQRALRVLDGWQADNDFLDSSGAPRALSLSADPAEFALLVRKYSGDIPPKAILRELLRLNLVGVSDGLVVVKRLDPDKRAMRQVQTMASALAPIIARLATGPNLPRFVGREITLTVPDQKAHRLLHKQLNEAVRSFFLNLQNAADGASLPRRGTTGDEKQTQISVLISAQ